jgi:hypothetical protein
MLVAICNRLFQIGRETRTIEIDDSIVRRVVRVRYRFEPTTGQFKRTGSRTNGGRWQALKMPASELGVRRGYRDAALQ